MKKTFTIIILFLVCDVFGDDVKSVTVTAGDSVALNTDLRELHEDDVIWWRFGKGESKNLLAEIVKQKIWYARGRFRGKLQISGSQTGDLTIMNMKIKYSGFYEAEINIVNGTLYKRFMVTVIESPVINAGPSEVASFTVTEGESVILPCNVQTQKDDLILWRFGDESVLIAEVDMEDDMISLFDGTDGSFRNRLKLKNQTGDLIITKSKPKHTGVYQLKISSNNQTLYKTFSVIVKEAGLSSAVIAWLCVFFLLVIAAVIAAGFILYCRSISELKHEVKSMSVVEGESVTLHTYIELQEDAVVEWRYGDDKIIAQIKDKNIIIDDEVLDGRFRDGLKLDCDTGSLTITKFKAEQAGLYEVKITSSKGTSNSKFSVDLRARVRAGKVGESVTLDTCVAEIQRNDEILWMFGDMRIAEYTGGTDKPTLNKTDERFKDRLDMNSHTGDLTIRNIRPENTGEYKVKIKRRSGIEKDRKFNVAFSVQATKGGFVTLPTKVKIQDGNKVEWTSKDKTTLVTGMNEGRLEIIPETGDLTITDIKQTDEGVYTLKLTNTDGKIAYRIFNVDVVAKVHLNFLKQQNSEMIRTGKVGGSVTLDTGVTKIQRDDEILWMFGDMRIARYIGGTNESTLYDYIDERFTDRLEVNHRTGDLTIRNFRTEHTGLYKVQIKNSSGNKDRTFNVAFSVQATKGRSVTLPTKLKIQEGDELEWTSEDKTSLVTGINGEDCKTSYTEDERFRDRLEMNAQTGTLTITDIRQTDEGVYKLQLINTDGKITYRIFNVDVTGKIQIQHNLVRATKGESVTLPTNVKIQEGDTVEWTSKDKTTLVTGMNGDSTKTSYEDVVRFKARLKMNPETGDLTITDIRETDEGVYTLQLINTDGKITQIIFNVDVIITDKVDGNIQKQQNSEMIRTGKVGESVTLDTCVTKIQRDDEILWMFEDMRIAQFIGGTNESTLYDYTDERFKDSLELNHQTGDLTIKNMRTEHTGAYKVQIKNRSGTKDRRFIVAYYVQPSKGGSVTICAKVKIKVGDAVEWTSKDKTSLVNGMNGDDSKTSFTDDKRFKGRLKMNAQTGDLTITDIRETDEGVYTLHLINTDGKITYRIFNVDLLGHGIIQNQQNSDSVGVSDKSVVVEMTPLLDKADRSKT